MVGCFFAWLVGYFVFENWHSWMRVDKWVWNESVKMIDNAKDNCRMIMEGDLWKRNEIWSYTYANQNAMFYYRTQQLDESYHKADCDFNSTNIWMEKWPFSSRYLICWNTTCSEFNCLISFFSCNKKYCKRWRKSPLFTFLLT